MLNPDTAEDSEKDEDTLEIKTVKYRELIQKSQDGDDRRDVRQGGARDTEVLISCTAGYII